MISDDPIYRKFHKKENEDRQQFLIRVKSEGNRDDMIIAVVDELKNFVLDLIKVYKRTLAAEFEDLMSDFYLAVCAHIDDYDPKESSPSAYFTMYINNAHREECRGSIPQYYLGKGTKLDKIAKEEGYPEGLLSNDLSDMTLSLISGESLTTVKKTRDVFARTICSIEEFANLEDTLHSSPEQLAVRAEEIHALHEAFNSLSRFEQFIFFAYSMGNSNKEEGGLSLKGLVGYLQKHYKDFDLKTAPTQVSLKRSMAIVRRKLRSNRVMRASFFDYADEDGDVDLFMDSMKVDLEDPENLAELD